MSTATEPSAPDQFAAMRELRPGLRTDLKITRTLTQGVPVYIVFDPVKFQSHRLSLIDYRVAGSLSDRHTLQTSFEKCTQSGVLDEDEEETFFAFVSQLQTLGLLTTSKQDSDSLYKKFQHREEAKRKGFFFSLLFATIPLTDPDKFLDNTASYVSWLFTKAALIFWIVLGIGAVAIVSQRLGEFVSPLNGALAAKNLVFLALSFVALKIVHEFGHGYACKKFGGSVPEMGCKLIVMMPLAYVDTTSAWSFAKQSQRLIVMLAGMYIEAIVAVVCVYIWAASPHSFIGSCAFQLIFMAGLATVLFNANPLMKYDGYFVLSDLIGIPNLRSRSTKYFHGVLKRAFLGISIEEQLSRRDRFIYLSYGICAGIYSTVLTVSIAFMVAAMFGPIGVVIAMIQLFSMIRKSITGFFGYLWSSEETNGVRVRSQRIAIAVAIIVPAIIGYFPIPGRIIVTGLASGSKLISVRTPTEGFVASIHHDGDDEVESGESLVTLENLSVENKHAVQIINARLAQQKAIHASRQDPGEGQKLQAMAQESIARMKAIEKDALSLKIQSPQNGRLAFIIDADRKGSFIQAGEVVAKISAGNCRVRAWISEEQISNSNIQFDAPIELRFADLATKTFWGNIASLAPAKRGEFDDLALTTMGSGGIKIDPQTGKTEENMYMLEIDVIDLPAKDVLLDSRVNIVLKRRHQSLFSWTVKSLRNFLDRLTL